MTVQWSNCHALFKEDKFHVDMQGNYKSFFQDSTFKSTYGLKLEPSGKSLWVCVSDANYSKYSSPEPSKRQAGLLQLICLQRKR